MRTCPRLYPNDQLRVDQATALDALGVLGGDQIVGDHRHAHPGVGEHWQQPLDQSGLTRSHRTTDADLEGARAASLQNVQPTQRHAIDRFAVAQLAVSGHPVRLRVDLNRRQRVVVQHVALGQRARVTG